LENPEPRYVLECFPVIFVFAAAALSHATGDSEQTTDCVAAANAALKI
jgi:hypothetical protein